MNTSLALTPAIQRLWQAHKVRHLLPPIKDIERHKVRHTLPHCEDYGRHIRLDTYSQNSSLGDLKWVIFVTAAATVDMTSVVVVVVASVSFRVKFLWLLREHISVFHSLSHVLHGRVAENDLKR